MSSIIKIFNNHLLEFIDDTSIIFSDKKTIIQFKKYVKNIMLLNASKPIKLWYEYSIKYQREINNKNHMFFLNKNYIKEIKKQWLLDYIENFKLEIKKTSEENKEKIMCYLLNLTKIAIMYKTN